MFGIGDPGATWFDMSCAAWTTGGLAGTAPPGDYAGIGLKLNNGSPYSLLGNTGITVRIESSHPVIFFLTELTGGYEFAYTIPGNANPQTVQIPFSSLQPFAGTPSGANLDPTQITDIGFAAQNPAGFGYAIHQVFLY
jgi:hypothetical protein